MGYLLHSKIDIKNDIDSNEVYKSVNWLKKVGI